MEEFIAQVSAKLGVTPEQSRAATAGVLKVIREQCGSSEFAGILAKIPGAESLMKTAETSPAEESTGGGLMGSLTQMAGGLMGGKSGAAMGVVGALSKAGVDSGKSGGFLQMLISYLKEHLDGDTVRTLLSKVGGLGGGG